MDQWGGAHGSAGDRVRTFAYDSLGRVVTANNPEAGTIQYSYSSGSSLCSGAASNVCSRTDARGIVTTYSYNDPLNRLTTKSYSDGTPTVNLTYDATTPIDGSYNFIGQLSEVTTSRGSTVDTNWVSAGYDEEGRPEGDALCFVASWLCNSSVYSQQYYYYDLAGKVSAYDYAFSTDPAAFGTGMEVQYNYDTAGRLGAIDVGPVVNSSFIDPLVPLMTATSFNAWAG